MIIRSSRWCFRDRFKAYLCTLGLLLTSLPVVAQSDFELLMSQAAQFSSQGQVSLSIDSLRQAQALAGEGTHSTRVAAALGRALLRGQQYAEAANHLETAYQASSGSHRATLAIDLGSVAQYQRQSARAERYYREAITAAVDDPELLSVAELSLARMLPKPQAIALLHRVDRRLGGSSTNAHLSVNIGNQAAAQGAIALAYRSLDAAVNGSAKGSRTQTEALSGLAQLYEDKGRSADATRLNQRALGQLDAGASGLEELQLELEWRAARLARMQGDESLALAAYQRAAEHLERIRQDMPIEYLDGSSSYSTTIVPLYQGLLELLFRQASTLSQDPDLRERYLTRARDVIELTHQAEMQDFLGDRCVVTAQPESGAGQAAPAQGHAYLYTAELANSTVLMLVTPNNILHREIDVPGLRAMAEDFAEQLRYGHADYRENAEALYDLLLRPMESTLQDDDIGTLVIIPDGALRMVSFGALHDGREFAIQKRAISTTTGISMTRLGAPKGEIRALVAGLSEPGSVVDKLIKRTTADMGVSELADVTSRGLAYELTTLRSGRGLSVVSSSAAASAPTTIPTAPVQPATSSSTSKVAPVAAPLQELMSSAELKRELALPGVKEEVEAISKTLSATQLLNQSFTLDQFQGEAENGDYRILHIASHGVFGNNAESSFILTFDDLLTLNGLQKTLSADTFRSNPIELITLSACETAEGNARAPLGISGAAIKARARSVLGTLWPVEDNAARELMEIFYSGLSTDRMTKVAALQNAQISLIEGGEMEHPFYWAPFTLIGNWM